MLVPLLALRLGPHPYTRPASTAQRDGLRSLVMVGDGATDAEARAPGAADLFVCYGGVVRGRGRGHPSGRHRRSRVSLWRSWRQRPAPQAPLTPAPCASALAAGAWPQPLDPVHTCCTQNAPCPRPAAFRCCVRTWPPVRTGHSPTSTPCWTLCGLALAATAAATMVHCDGKD